MYLGVWQKEEVAGEFHFKNTRWWFALVCNPTSPNLTQNSEKQPLTSATAWADSPLGFHP